MTLEELLECSASELEKMTDTQLLEHFQKSLCVTRPELAPRKPQQKNVGPAIVITPQKQKALEALAAAGVDMEFLKYRKKR